MISSRLDSGVIVGVWRMTRKLDFKEKSLGEDRGFSELDSRSSTYSPSTPGCGMIAADDDEVNTKRVTVALLAAA